MAGCYGSRLETQMISSGNIFANLPARLPMEEATVIAERAGAVVERIVSIGQASPPGFWYDQDWAEWVIVLSGAAGLLVEGESAPRRLGPGDYVELTAHVRHRVEWTDPDRPTVWLAVHWKGGTEERGRNAGPGFASKMFARSRCDGLESVSRPPGPSAVRRRALP